MKLSTLNSGLVAHLPLDEASLKSSVILGDKTPRQNDGISANAPNFVADRMGQIRAMSFNGTTDYIDCGDDDSLNMGTHNFTIQAWIKTTQTAGSFPAIIGKGYLQSGVNGYGLYLNSADSYKIFLQVRDSTGSVEVSGGSINDGLWHHIVGIREHSTNTSTIYVDGKLIDTDTAPIINYDNNRKFGIGKRYEAGWSFPFNGSIADLRIYNRIITPAEITMLFQEYRSKISMGSLMKGLVLDLPLTSQRYNAGNSKFDDLTPYQNRGTNSGATIGADYASFNGTSDNIRIADSESLSPTSAMTAMCWVKGAAALDKVIFSHYDYGNNQRTFSIFSSNVSPYNKLGMIISDNGTHSVGHRKNYYSSIVAFDNTWHLVGFTFDAGTLKLFVDGVEDINSTKIYDDAITTMHNSTADVMVGCYLTSDTPAGFFAGDITYARMYNRALTNAEWLLRFEKQKGEFL